MVTNWFLVFCSEWREEQEEKWMCGCKRIRTVGVESDCLDNTYFRILVHKDSCFTYEQVRDVLQSVSKCNYMYNVRKWIPVFWMGDHQSSYVSSRICVNVSFLDDNQEQQSKCGCFSWRKSLRILCHDFIRKILRYLQLERNPDLLDSVPGTPLLHPVVKQTTFFQGDQNSLTFRRKK